MRTPNRVATITAVAVLGWSACGDDGPPAFSAERVVELVGENDLFDVTTIDATVGETVLIEFDNRDAGTNHNLVVEGTADGTVETGIALGPVLQQLEVTFTEPGEHEYWCEVHPDDMRGTVVVTG